MSKQAFHLWGLQVLLIGKLLPPTQESQSPTHTHISVWSRSPPRFIHLFWSCVQNVKWTTRPRHRVLFTPFEISFLASCSLSVVLSPLFYLHLPESASPSFFTIFFIDLVLPPSLFSFLVLLPPSPLSSLYQSVGCAFVRLFGIKSDSLRDWMCVAMACCIWKAIHSAGTLLFNLKQDWCWQTLHPLSSKMFPPLHTPIADGQRAYATL